MKNNWKKQFLTIYAGQAFSLLGSAAVQFSIIWWLTIQTESALVLAFSTIVAFIPNMIIGPFAGVIVDRYNRKTVMIIADGLIALSSAVLGVAFFIQTPPIWFIFVILFIRGLGNTFHSPAMQAAIPMLVPSEMLTKAGGWSNLISSASNMLGPVLGALLMDVASLSAIMLVDIVGAVIAIACLLLVKIPDIPRSEEEFNLLKDLRDGFVAMRNNKPLMAIFLPMLMMNVLYMPLGSLFPLLIRTHFMGNAGHTSIAEFVFAFGLLASSLIVGIWGGMKKRFLMASLAMVLLGVVSLISGILPPNIFGFIVFVVCCFFMGASGTFMNVPIMAYTQETIAPEVMGKVFSLMMTVMTLSMPIGLLIAGPVSDMIGVNVWYLYSGVALVLTGIWALIITKPFEQETMLKESSDNYENI